MVELTVVELQFEQAVVVVAAVVDKCFVQLALGL